MSEKILPKSKSLSRYFVGLPLIDRVSKSFLISQLKKISHGSITIIDQGEVLKLGTGGELNVTIRVKKSSFYSRTLIGGSIGNAESYIDNDWEVDDLTNLVRLFVKNRDVLQKIDGNIVNLLRPVQRFFHGLRSNTVTGSKQNIRSHYDIGNDFFELFLDKRMMYSSAVFDDKTSNLEEASLKKLRTVCEKLNLTADDHLLEIGTGWGGLAIFAATEYGCRVTTTTISQEQYEYAKARIKELNLTDKITLLSEDYRNLTGRYDKLVSIEMIEAVGLENLDTFFKICSERLKPNGIMLLQSITIRDQFYATAGKSVDFIQRHVFPGSGIPSINAIMQAVTKSTDFVMTAQQDYAEDYAQTLWHWSKKFNEKKQAVINLGYPEYLIRLWNFYFSYCEGGFRERATGVSQIVFAKPTFKNRSLI